MLDEYVALPAALDDAAVDIVALAVESQLRDREPDLPGDEHWPWASIWTGSPERRDRVLRVLGSVSNPQQADRLVDRLDFHLAATSYQPEGLDDETMAAVLGVVCRLPGSRAAELIDHLFATAPLGAMGLKAAFDAMCVVADLSRGECLERELRSPSRRRIRRVLHALGQIEDQSCSEQVLSLLDDQRAWLRVAAAQLLGEFEATEAMRDAVWARLRDGAGKVSQELLLALGVWRDERAVPALIAMLDEDDADLVATAVSVLWRFPDHADVADAIVAVASRDDPGLWENCAFVLTDFGDPRALDVVMKLLGSDELDHARSGLFFVARASETVTLEAQKGRIVERVLELLGNDDAQTRLTARAALLEMRDPRGLEGLWTDLDRTDARVEGNVRSYAVAKLKEWRPDDFDAAELRPLLADPDPSMRAQACLVAGQAKASQLADVLQGLADDDAEVEWHPGKSVGQMASEALDRIAGLRPPWEPHPDARRPSFAE